jgi:hypothetical protein
MKSLAEASSPCQRNERTNFQRPFAHALKSGQTAICGIVRLAMLVGAARGIGGQALKDSRMVRWEVRRRPACVDYADPILRTGAIIACR